MISVIVGKKGSGKTAKLVDRMNGMAKDRSKTVVCLVRGDRLDTQIKPQIRLINVNDYPIEGYTDLLSFIAGICSKDYDLTDIYVDSITKVTKTEDINEFSKFLDKLKSFSDESNINFTFILSHDPKELPKEVVEYSFAEE